MHEKINVLQYVPYFPPHMGGLETHAAEWAKWRVKKGYGTCMVATYGVGQEKEVLSYEIDGYTVICIPAFEIIPTFPFPKFWTRKYWQAHKKIRQFKADILITRTRFFLSSFFGGVFAKIHRIKRVHIEHGSGYVKLSSGLKNIIAYIYDNIVGRRIFHFADTLIAVSNACNLFIQDTMKVKRTVHVIYRGLDSTYTSEKKNTSYEDLHERFPGKIIIGYVGRLYKRKNVASLIAAYKKIYTNDKYVQLVIVGDGEDLEKLQSMQENHLVYFTGGVSKEEALYLQRQFDVHVHSSSVGGGLATTLLQAMALGLCIVATPYEGAKEVIKNDYNGILIASDTMQDIADGIQRGLDSLDKKEQRAEINKDIIEKEFTREKNIEKYYNIIKAV